VEVDLATAEGGVRLRLLVRERPAIARTEFTGNDAVSKEDLDEALSSTLKAGDVLSYAAVQRAVQRLRDKYAEEGYFLAEVKSEVVPRGGGQVLVRFAVREGHKVRVRRVQFVGNLSVPTADLEEVMITGKGGLLADSGSAARGRSGRTPSSVTS
jgi:outer membrane protein insertion porin family